MTNNTNIKVAEKNKEIVASIKDYSEGEPLQKNRGKRYRYRVTFVDGSYYESNSKSEISTRIVYEANNNRDCILKSANKKHNEKMKEIKDVAITDETIDYIHNDIETTIKINKEIKEAHKPVKTLQKYRVYDLLDGREVLGHADTMKQVHEIAQEQYDDTDGDCDIHYAELNQETNKYKFTFVKRVMLKGND